ncbi:MAG TPA: response regulator transcription factor [Dongiaceae bacterium]
MIQNDAAAAEQIRLGLIDDGHQVDQVSDGLTGLELGRRPGYDVLIIDRLLPGLDGLSLIKRLRRQGLETPILFMTTAATTTDRVDGFAAGGDVCLIKPFAFAELLARLTSLTRRPARLAEQAMLRVGDLHMNLSDRTVIRANRSITLQPREFKLLECLMRHPGRIMTRSTLLERVWSIHFDPRTNVVETHISRLRAKIDKPFATKMIMTIRGAGYCLDAPEAPSR